jgi:hypothetical protein
MTRTDTAPWVHRTALPVVAGQFTRDGTYLVLGALDADGTDRTVLLASLGAGVVVRIADPLDPVQWWVYTCTQPATDEGDGTYRVRVTSGGHGPLPDPADLLRCDLTFLNVNMPPDPPSPPGRPTVDDLAEWLGVPPATEFLDVSLLVAIDRQDAACVVEPYTEALRYACLRRAARAYAARPHTLGTVDGGDFGVQRIARWDAEIQDAEAGYLRGAFA